MHQLQHTSMIPTKLSICKRRTLNTMCAHLLCLLPHSHLPPCQLLDESCTSTLCLSVQSTCLWPVPCTLYILHQHNCITLYALYYNNTAIAAASFITCPLSVVGVPSLITVIVSVPPIFTTCMLYFAQLLEYDISTSSLHYLHYSQCM